MLSNLHHPRIEIAEGIGLDTIAETFAQALHFKCEPILSTLLAVGTELATSDEDRLIRAIHDGAQNIVKPRSGRLCHPNEHGPSCARPPQNFRSAR